MGRSQITLDRIEKAGIISKGGKDWIIETTDPFHDSKLATVGYPDAEGAGSLVFEVQQQLVVNPPVTGAWDLNVFILPEALQLSVIQQNETLTGGGESIVTAATSTFGSVSLVTAVAVASGSPTWNNVTAGVAAPGSVASSNINAYLTGSSRVVSVGFEAVNTSPEIGMQGQVACYQVPQCNEMEVINCVGAGTATPYGMQGVMVSRSPPTTITEAVNIPGAEQWAAKEGAYVIGTMCDVANPATGIQMCGRQFRYSAPLNLAGNALQTCPGVGVISNVVYNGSTGLPSSGNSQIVRPQPFDTNGAYFTGLAGSSSTYPSQITVNIKVIIERFPSPFDSNIALAKPSNPYDPRALELYSAMLQDMKPFCMVKDNPSGEFFQGLLDIVGKVAPVIGMIAAPFTGGASLALGSAIGAGVAGINSAITKTKEAKAERAVATSQRETAVAQAEEIKASKARTRARKAEASALAEKRRVVPPIPAPRTGLAAIKR